MESKTYFFRERNLLEILGDYKKLPPQDEKSGQFIQTCQAFKKNVNVRPESD